MKWLTELLKKMDKTKWMIVGLSGILLLVIALPTGSSQEKKELFTQPEEQESSQKAQVKAYKKQLADELEQALGCMEGVGKVRVMITFQDSGETVVEKDVVKSANGSGDSQLSSQYQESTVYQEADGRTPYISQEKLPAVEGVLIVAQGGGDSKVKQEMQEAVLALFPVQVHKIKIVKMQE
ncbi:MAG: stage III sporulation protein AG [Eubacterium sp.]|nr:stage III sporulation protein AG [Eubacterium sp.]